MKHKIKFVFERINSYESNVFMFQSGIVANGGMIFEGTIKGAECQIKSYSCPEIDTVSDYFISIFVNGSDSSEDYKIVGRRISNRHKQLLKKVQDAYNNREN